mmetsp:Transcript_24244/g.50392  ORF Transcript_24244/g.50392 Transcript_24244/m.50392 type:complete len:114 (+) Transcript_24244:1699-2040(+)
MLTVVYLTTFAVAFGIADAHDVGGSSSGAGVQDVVAAVGAGRMMAAELASEAPLTDVEEHTWALSEFALPLEYSSVAFPETQDHWCCGIHLCCHNKCILNDKQYQPESMDKII